MTSFELDVRLVSYGPPSKELLAGITPWEGEQAAQAALPPWNVARKLSTKCEKSLRNLGERAESVDIVNTGWGPRA